MIITWAVIATALFIASFIWACYSNDKLEDEQFDHDNNKHRLEECRKVRDNYMLWFSEELDLKMKYFLELEELKRKVNG